MPLGIYSDIGVEKWHSDDVDGKSLIVQKGGKAGLVEMDSGKKIIPIAYDDIACNRLYCNATYKDKTKIFDLSTNSFILDNKAYDAAYFGAKKHILKLKYFGVLDGKDFLVVDPSGQVVTKLASLGGYDDYWIDFGNSPVTKQTKVYVIVQTGKTPKKGCAPAKQYTYTFDTKKITTKTTTICGGM